MKILVVLVLFGSINLLNAKTTDLYEHAKSVRVESQKGAKKRVEKKKPLIAKRVLESIDKKYSKN